jgi:hypothetical protein
MDTTYLLLFCVAVVSMSPVSARGMLELQMLGYSSKGVDAEGGAWDPKFVITFTSPNGEVQARETGVHINKNDVDLRGITFLWIYSGSWDMQNWHGRLHVDVYDLGILMNDHMDTFNETVTFTDHATRMSWQEKTARGQGSSLRYRFRLHWLHW